MLFMTLFRHLFLSLSIIYILGGCRNDTGQNNQIFQYSIKDINPSSQSYGSNVGPSYFKGKVTLHYFGHFTWGTCAARFGELNDIVNELKSRNYIVELVGIGKQTHISGLSSWTNDNDSPICSDQSPFSTWDNWGASQRSLFILDQNLQLVLKESVLNGIPNNLTELLENLATSNEISLWFWSGSYYHYHSYAKLFWLINNKLAWLWNISYCIHQKCY